MHSYSFGGYCFMFADRTWFMDICPSVINSAEIKLSLAIVPDKYFELGWLLAPPPPA